MRLATGAVCMVLAGAALLLPAVANAAPNPTSFHVLVLTEGNAADGQYAALSKAASKATPKFETDQAKRSENFIKPNVLKHYNAVVFLNTGADVLNAEEQATFEAYFRAGGGFVGVGKAVDTNPGWAFLTEILGTRAAGRLDAQTVTNKVADRVHDASKSLPEYWDLSDTYYNWSANVRGQSHVLTTVSDAPFDRTGDGPQIRTLTGGTMGADHPVTWCKDWKGGRSYYTNHGASGAAFNDPSWAVFSKELTGAITWASGQSDPVYSDCGATVTANYQQSFVAAPPNLSEPIGFDVLPDGSGRVIQTDRRGGVRLHDPVSNSTTVLAQLPVYIANEDGGYGPEVDNNFNTNKWVYLYYSPATVEDVRFADGTLHTVTTPLNDPATPQNEQNAPNFAASLSAWDQYNGYFQLSRFKFVDATANEQAHLDLASEQQILRVPNNRGACCHVAGDIDFDSKNNLWMVTGDDTPAGGGNSGGFAPFNDQLTNESQTIAVTGATGGTFTLTFDGQTTAPIAFPLDNAAIESALEALSNLDDVAVTTVPGTGTRTVNFRGNQAEQNVPQMTGDGTGLTGMAPTLTVAMALANNGQGLNVPLEGGMFNAPFVDARRTAQNTNDLRGKVLRISVKAGDIAPAEENKFAGAYSVPAGNLYPVGTARTRPEVYAMGFRNPFRLTLDKNRCRVRQRLLARLAGPRAVPRAGRHRPLRDRAQAGELRLAALLPDGPRLLQVGLQQLRTAAERGRARAQRVRQRDARPAEHLALGRERRPDGRAGPRVRASDHQPGDLVLVPRQQSAVPVRHPVLRLVRPERPAIPDRRDVPAACSRSCSPAGWARTGRRRTTTTRPARARRSSRRTGTGRG